MYRHNLFSLTHTTLLLLVITSSQKVCFCQGTRTFPPVSTDWWQIGGCAVGSAATSDGFISGSTADTAGMLIKGRLGHRCRLWCENHKAPRYKNIEPCGNESVQGFSRPLVTHRPLSADRNFGQLSFAASFNIHAPQSREKNETVSAQRVSPGAPDLRAFITVICSKRQFPSQHKSCAGDTCFACLSIRLCVVEDFETRSAFSCFSKVRKYRKYSNFTPGSRAFISGLEIPADSWH